MLMCFFSTSRGGEQPTVMCMKFLQGFCFATGFLLFFFFFFFVFFFQPKGCSFDPRAAASGAIGEKLSPAESEALNSILGQLLTSGHVAQAHSLAFQMNHASSDLQLVCCAFQLAQVWELIVL